MPDPAYPAARAAAHIIQTHFARHLALPSGGKRFAVVMTADGAAGNPLSQITDGGGALLIRGWVACHNARNTMRRSPVFVLALLLPIAAVAPAQPIPGVEGRSYFAPEKDLAQRAMRSQLPSLARTLPQPLEIRLGALGGDERKRFEMAGRAEAKAAGVHRRVDPNLLERGRAESLDGQRSVWRLALHSQDAAGLRIHFTGFDAGSGRVWVHAGTGEESEIRGPYTGKGLYGDGDFWSDVVLGEILVVEYEPGRPLGPGETPLSRSPKYLTWPRGRFHALPKT